MDNNIVSAQNSKENLDRLAAQRNAYSSAKRWYALQLLLALASVLISFISLVKDSPGVAEVGAFLGVLFTIIDEAWLSRLVDSRKETGARIQELFDTEVLGLPWNGILVGDKPDHEEVSKYASKSRADSSARDGLPDWYTDKIGSIPHHAAAVICQRSNLWWDAEQKKFYSNILSFVAAIFVICLIGAGYSADLSVPRWILLAVAPSLPIIMLVVRQRHENKASEDTLIRLKGHVDHLWSDILSLGFDETNLSRATREIQDRIYSNRKNSPLVFDWFYKLIRNKYQANMDYGVVHMVSEYKTAHGL